MIRILLAVLISSLYLIPQWKYFNSGGKGSAFLAVDEPAYAARLERVIQGHPFVGNPWTYEEQNNPTVIPVFPEMFLGEIGKVTGLNTDKIIIVSRTILPVLSFFILALFLEILGLSPLFATVVSFWIMTEPGLIWYKPFAGILLKFDNLPLNRFVNPLLPIFVFFSSLYLWALLIFKKSNIKIATLTAAVSSLCFYISPYYWTHLVAGGLVFLTVEFMLNKKNQNLKSLGIAVALFFLLSIPYLISVLKLRNFAGYSTFSWRNGLLLKDHAWYLLPHKTLWFFVASSVFLLVIKNTKEVRFLLAFAWGGLLCYFSSLVTGISFQNFHYHFTLAPLLFILLAWVIYNRFSFLQKPLSAAVLVVLFLINAFLAQIKSPILSLDNSYQNAWTWLKLNAQPDDVVVAEEETLAQVPARTGLRVLTEQHLVAEIMDYSEILKRFQTLWLIAGENSKSLAARITPTHEAPINQWIYGMNPQLLEKFKNNNYPSLEYDQVKFVAAEVASDWGKLTLNEKVNLSKNFKISFLVRGPNETKWGNTPDRLLDLEPVFSAQNIRIDRIKGWKPLVKIHEGLFNQTMRNLYKYSQNNNP